MRFTAGNRLLLLVAAAVFGSTARAQNAVFIQRTEIAQSVVAGSDADKNPQTPREAFRLLPGFQVERLFTVPKEQMGSWVAMTVDPKGRVIAAAETNQGLFRVTPPAIGSSEPTRVERLKVDIPAAQGLLFAFDSLYVTHNGRSALYRLRDTDGDDQFDDVKKLADFQGAGDHGPHATRVSPDGKRLYLIAGNFTALPIDVDADPPQRLGGPRTGQRHARLVPGGRSRIVPNWDEDLLLPRQWDAGGFGIGVMAPGGWIAATDPDGKEWEVLTVGLRNPYDMALNADGEIFTYDSDMEPDLGLPWYRPTRVCHATSGGEFGWRNGTGNWPAYRVDSLPPVVDMGQGSPVGVEFGYGTRFPAKYQRALFCLDWSYGTIHAVQITPEGASYTGTRETFLARTPLPLTDTAVGRDGALYFTTGGRGTQSELFRVTYVGGEPTTPVDARDEQFADQRALRQKIEVYQAQIDDPAEAVATLVPLLGHADRHIRYAARESLEHVEPKYWQDQVLTSEVPDTLIGGVVALAHLVDAPEQAKLLSALDRLNFSQLSPRVLVDALRAWALTMIRLGAPSPEVEAHWAAQFDPLFPVTAGRVADGYWRDILNRELCETLVFLKSPTVVGKSIALVKQPAAAEPPPANAAEIAAEIAAMAARNPQFGDNVLTMLNNPKETQKVAYLFALRNMREGWEPAERLFYFTWLRDERKKQASRNFGLFLKNIEQDAYDNATDTDRLVVDAAQLREPTPAVELPRPLGPGRSYTVDDLVALSAAQPKGRNFANGKRSYAAARCVVCHRFGGEGGSTGPDLTQAAGRFTLRDLADSIVEPSKVVSDLYRATVVETHDGRRLTGRIIGSTPEAITLLTDPEVATKWVRVSTADIERQETSPVSLMPGNLLTPLNSSEMLDLLAYLLSRGNPQDPLFSP